MNEADNIGKDYIFVKTTKRTFTRIFHKDITHIMGDKDYCWIFTEDKKFHTHSTLFGLLSILPKNIFCRSQISFIVNIDKIEIIECHDIHIGNHTIPIGSRYKKQLLEKINFVKTTSQNRRILKSLTL